MNSYDIYARTPRKRVYITETNIQKSLKTAQNIK